MTRSLTFYTNPQSRGRTVRWMLEEVGAPYETVVLDYGPAMKAPDYLAINPMGKVPAIRHGATVVTEAAAIVTYLAEAFPEAGLVGADKGSYYRWLFFAAGPLEAAFLNTFLGFEAPPEAQARLGYGTYARALDTLEKAVSANEWLAGPAFSAADLYVGAVIGWMARLGTLGERPILSAFFDRMKTRPALIRAATIDSALIAQKG